MKLKKYLALAVSCAVLTACGGSSGNSAAQTGLAPANNNNATASAPAGKVLRVGTNAEFAPFESLTETKEVQGFDIDVMRAMGEAGGFQVEFSHKPWDSLFPSLANSDVDALIAAITITDERKATVNFTEPYYKITQVVMVPPSKTVNSIEDLKKMSKVGVVTGNTGDFAAQKIFGATSSQIARFDSAPVMIKEVENGGVDAGISDSAVVAYYIKNNNKTDFKMLEVPDFTVENYGIAVRKDDEATLRLLNDSLKKIRENGKYAEIEAKYFAK